MASRHKALTTFFDGVPSLPSADQYCGDFAEKKVIEAQENLAGKKDANAASGRDQSHHPPYVEKRCNNCHDKTTESGFVKPTKELCFVCHTNFIKGPFVHGPAAASDCLFCHEPHTSRFKSLLKKDTSETCAICHREKRMATLMHKKMADSNITCTECHNPHYGNSKFFLK